MKAHEVAYRAWRRAAERGYGKRNSVHQSTIDRVDANIRRLKARYERLRAEAKEEDVPGL